MASQVRAPARSKCPKCGASCVWYCPNPSCLELVVERSLVPSVSLPVRVAISHHRSERLKKCTGIHAKVLDPEMVDVFVMNQDLPDFSANGDTVALYPSPDAVLLSELSSEELSRIKRVVLVEATWVSARGAVAEARIDGIRHIRVDGGRVTRNWRPQRGTKPHNPNGFSSIEAIHQFMLEYGLAAGIPDIHSRVDGLLHFFEWQRSLAVKPTLLDDV